jgi:Mg-chelatase subunit ChlD
LPNDPETRLTAWLLGELDPDEAAALAREVEQDPALRLLRDRLAGTIHFVRAATAASATEAAGPAKPRPRMSTGRREKLLASFRVLSLPAAQATQFFGPNGRQWLVAVAASLALVVIGAGMLLPALSRAKSKSLEVASRQAERQLAFEREFRANEQPAVDGQNRPGEARPGAPQAPRQDIFLPGRSSEGTAEPADDKSPRPATDLSLLTRYALLAPDQVSRLAETSKEKETAIGQLTGSGGSQTAKSDQESYPNAGFGPFAPENGIATAGDGPGGFGGGVGPNSSSRRLRSEAISSGKEAQPGQAVRGLVTNQAWADFDNAGDLDLYLNAPRFASGRTAESRSDKQRFEDQTALGREVRDSGLAPDGSRAPAVAANSAAEAEDLAPLPLKLPVPAFMGTPADLPASPPASASREVDRKDLASPPAPEERGASAPGLGGADTLALAATPALKTAIAPTAPVPGPTVAAGLPVSATRGDEAAPRRDAPPPTPQPEVATAENAFSTFSLNVSDVSFKLAAASLENGQLPDPASIRAEEFINAFDYRDAQPLPGAPLGFHWERARYPFAHNRELVRFAVRVAAAGREAGRPLNLVLLLDNSGSKERADRVQILREALRVLAGQLQAADKVSVVAFARTARLWVDGLPGERANELLGRLGELVPEGGTNLEDALRTAYLTASRHFNPEGVNRVVLLTDGAANLGDVNPDSLQAGVDSWRRRGIALDCFGIGWEDYNDDLLEVLARHGDGRYGFLNSPEEAASDFAPQLAGALRVAAADVKVQVEFNPHRVTTWRQMGYARHQLAKEQFRDNTVDAAELGAAEAGNGLYVLEVNPQGHGHLGVVRVRFREPAAGRHRELEWTLIYAGSAPPLQQASLTLRLAGTAAAFAELLAGSPFAADVTVGQLVSLLHGVSPQFQPDPRPARLETMLRQARSLGLN